jgi:hypothetical protein
VVFWDRHGRTKKYRIEHENLLFFTKSNKYTYNADAIRVPYESEKAGGGRTHNPLGKTCGTVWRFSRVQRNAKEFTGHSTQKPLELSDRVIKASSNEGDLIYIPFGGSGSEIESCISKHMGIWDYDYKSKKKVLPRPDSRLSKLVHLADYIASRKCLEFNFDIEVVR